MVNTNINKHALSRMIERNVLCQNKKLNKKQIKRNKKTALQKLKREMNNHFAYSIGNDTYEYYYAGLDKKGLCIKYIYETFSDTIVTVIRNIDINKKQKSIN